METQSAGEQSVRSVTKGGNSSISKAFCRCGEGWKCVITTRTEGTDAGKSFFNCGENCTCVIYGDGTVTKGAVLQEGETFANEPDCECGEAWKCVISKVEGPDAGKGFSECAGDCTCVTAA